MTLCKKSLRFPAWLSSVVFGLVLLLGANPIRAQIRTVLVSPVPGDPVASGTALKNALAGISFPSATNRWLLKIEPGIYDIGTLSLGMRSWVDIEGSGIGVTTIRGRVEESGGTINGANNSELRLLTVESEGEIVPHMTFRMAMLNSFASPRLYRVRFSATGAGEVFGILNHNNSAPLIEECEISATHLGNGPVVGVGFNNFTNAPPIGRSAILRSKITVTGGGDNYGVRLGNSPYLAEVRDSRIDAAGGQNTYGIFAYPVPGWNWRGDEQLQIRNTEIVSSGGSSAYGINIESNQPNQPVRLSLDIVGGRVWGSHYGIVQGGPNPIGIQGSYVLGMTKTIQTAGSIVIGSTLLYGGPATAQGWIGCVGVWDEAAVFYAQGACP